jgi:hypothetical protein
MSRLKTSFSFWAFVAFVALFALQAFPLTGIYLMFLLAPLWCGFLAQAVLLGLLVEGILGRIPRLLIIVPLLAYGAYYAAYVKQTLEINAKATQMQASNPTLVRKFEPSANSLVLPRSKAELAASHYDVLVTYDVNANFKPQGYMSHRLIDAEQCAKAREVQAKFRAEKVIAAFGLAVSVRFNERGGFGNDNVIRNVCVLNFPEKPPLPPLVVSERGDTGVSARKPTIMEQFVDFNVDGEVFATYATASVWRLSPLPLLIIGCGLVDNPASWSCVADLNRNYETIDGTPKNVDKRLYDTPESIVLGLRKLTRADYASFTGDRRWSDFIDGIGGYPEDQTKFKAEQQADLFSQFADFVHDTGVETSGTGVFINLVYKGTVAPPREMLRAILQKPEQLVPLRDAIAARFVQLVQAKIGVNNAWLRLLDRSLAELPRESYVSMPDDEVKQLLNALAADRGWDYFRYLYVRMADAGPRSQNFFENDLKELSPHLRVPNARSPELAICRLGQASEDAKAILRKEFVESSKSDAYADSVVINSSAFVTLLKLGDPAAVADYPVNFTRPDVAGWYEAVREKKGETDIGPNNCVGWERPGQRNDNWRKRFPPALRPSLIYEDEDKTWVEAATN